MQSMHQTAFSSFSRFHIRTIMTERFTDKPDHCVCSMHTMHAMQPKNNSSKFNTSANCTHTSSTVLIPEATVLSSDALNNIRTIRFWARSQRPSALLFTCGVQLKMLGILSGFKFLLICVVSATKCTWHWHNTVHIKAQLLCWYILSCFQRRTVVWQLLLYESGNNSKVKVT